MGIKALFVFMENRVDKYLHLKRTVAFVVSLIFLLSFSSFSVAFAKDKTESGSEIFALAKGTDIALNFDEDNTAYFTFTVDEDDKYIFSWELKEECRVWLQTKNEKEGFGKDTTTEVFSRNESKEVSYALEKGVTYRLCIAVLSDVFCEESIILTAVKYCRHETVTDCPQENPTCVLGGYTKGIYCSDCDRWIKGHQEILPLDHCLSESYIVDKEATCVENGQKSRRCLYCGEKKDITVILSKGHVMGEGEVTKAPSYRAPGIRTFRCTECAAVLKREKIERLVEPSQEKKENLVKVNGLAVKKQRTKSITVRWDKLDAADGYIVKYSMDGKLWGEVKSENNRLMIKNLKPGTKYVIRVVAYIGDLEGEESSELVSFTNPLKTKLKSVASRKKKQVTVMWKKTEGASGYQIIYSASKKFKNYKSLVVKNGEKNGAKIKKLRSNKKYYIRVRAYKTVNSEKLYGAYSGIRSVKIK